MTNGSGSSTCFPGKAGNVGVTARDNRRFVAAVLYRYRAGIPWRDLPERFGDWKNTHRRFSRWAKNGIWQRVFEHLAADADNEYAMIDSTITTVPILPENGVGPSQPEWKGSECGIPAE